MHLLRSVLNFITDIIKSQKETISHFIENNGFNRASFYRMMNDASKISEDDICKISAALELDPKMDTEFRNVIRCAISGNETEFDNILEILSSKPDFFTERLCEVEYFSTNDSKNRIVRTFGEIIEDFSLDSDTSVEIKILNCLSPSALSSLYNFVSEIRNCVVNCDLKVVVEHIIEPKFFTQSSTVKLLLNIAHLIQFFPYTVFFMDNIEETGSAAGDSVNFRYLENSILVKVEKSSQKFFYVFKLFNTVNLRDYCISSCDENFYLFYSTVFNGLKPKISKDSSFGTVSAAEANDRISKLKMPYRKLLIKTDFCLDNILPQVWERFVKGAMKENPLVAREFRKKIDLQNKYVFLDDESFVFNQINILSRRFNNNEHPGAINIYDVDGIISFVKNRFTSETRDHFPPFDKCDVIAQLEYVLKQVKEHYGCQEWQQFYFCRKTGIFDNLFVVIFDNEGILLVNERSIDIINSNLLFFDPGIAKTLYETIANSLSSIEILSKDETIDFLENQLSLL